MSVPPVFSREESSAWRRGGTEETSTWRGRGDEPEREERRVIEPRRDRETRSTARDDEGEQEGSFVMSSRIGFQICGSTVTNTYQVSSIHLTMSRCILEHDQRAVLPQVSTGCHSSIPTAVNLSSAMV